MSHSATLRSVLIFGGAGFIGSNWAHYLLRHTDAKVHVFDNLSRRGVTGNLEDLRKAADNSDRLKITIGDVRDRMLVNRVVASASDIFNFAAQVAVTTSINDPRQDFEVNLGGTFNILEAARQSGNRPFLLFTSTNKVYGGMSSARLTSNRWRHQYPEESGTSESQPLDFHSPYGCSKGAADQYVHDYARIYNLPTVVFRMSCIAGGRQFGSEDQGWVAHFLYSALQDIPLFIYGDGRQVRDVLCVDDLVRAFEAVRVNVKRTAGEIFNVGGGMENTVSLLELMREIKKFTGHEVRHQFCPARPGDQLVYVTDYSKLTRYTGWQPRVTVRGTLERIHEWWLNHQDLFVPQSSIETPAVAGLQEVREAA